MLRVSADSSIEVLASDLASVLSRPLPDPMVAEWITVVSAGSMRWLRLELSRHLGASAEDRTDGVAANLDLLFPGSLTRRILTPGSHDESDPWEVERIAWVVLDVLVTNPEDERLGPLLRPAPGATAWGRARRLADLFDRYILHRPAMIRGWAAGEDIDGAGEPLRERDAWQPHLWRLVRDRIARPSFAELLPERIEALRSGDCPDDVPDRISLFGLTTVPGGAPFIELLDALATQRDVHLFLQQPSPAMTARVRAARKSVDISARVRADDSTGAAVRHPLLRSWGRPAREGVVLLGDRLGEAATGNADVASPDTLLHRLQDDIRQDAPPAGGFIPPTGDRSVRIRSCHGPTRQVEVLRDQLLHLLADDPHMAEDDIVVLCPALSEFAPLIESVFGLAAPIAPRSIAGTGDEHDTETHPGPPALSYRVTDQSLRTIYPLLAALAALVELLGSRFSDTAVLDFANLDPVRRRFRLTDNDLTRLADWAADANTRWGLDGDHRSRWGIPAEYEGGSWRTALDRLLLGIAVSDDASALAVGDVLPIAVEGSDASVVGRFAAMMARLAKLTDEAEHDRPAHEWTALLQQACDDLFAVDEQMQWQRAHLTNVLEGLADTATLDGEPNRVALTLGDVRHMVGGQLGGSAGRSDFFRGGITISSLTPLRGLPHKVVCLLGMDETAFALGSPDGDDLVAANPHVGDRDRRADARAAVLDAILAATSHLVVIRSDRSIVTNQPIPAAVVVDELHEVIESTLDPTCRAEVLPRIDVTHPRQGFDEINFRIGRSPGWEPLIDGPWSFDPLACEGARARAADHEAAQLLPDRLEPPDQQVIDLADLREFIRDPVKYFLRRVLDIRLPESPHRDKGGKLAAPTPGSSGIPRAAEGRDLVLNLDGLEAWKVRDRLLDHLVAGGDLESFLRRERARDVLPPGRLARTTLVDTTDKVLPLCDGLDELGVAGDPPEAVAIDITLPDGTRLVGAVRDDRADRPGPITVTVSDHKEKQHLVPWLDLLALTAQDPTRPWQSVLLHSAKSKAGYKARRFEIPLDPSDDRRMRAVENLELVVDLFRRGRAEPLPLFPELSYALYKGNDLGSTWSGFDGRGDGNDDWVRIAFEHADLDEILALPALDDDPPGLSSQRAKRYADHLWGSIDRSIEPPADRAEDGT